MPLSVGCEGGVSPPEPGLDTSLIGMILHSYSGNRLFNRQFVTD
jgi:hypothetical protein